MMFGWEPFMTERDKEHYEIWGKKELFGFGKSPALILIDIYRGVLGFERQPLLEQIKTIPGGMGLEGWEAVDRTALLLAKAREYKIPVIHVTALDKDGVKGWGARIKRTGRGAAKIPDELAQRRAEIVDEVAPIDGRIDYSKGGTKCIPGNRSSIYASVDGD